MLSETWGWLSLREIRTLCLSHQNPCRGSGLHLTHTRPGVRTAHDPSEAFVTTLYDSESCG